MSALAISVAFSPIPTFRVPRRSMDPSVVRDITGEFVTATESMFAPGQHGNPHPSETASLDLNHPDYRGRPSVLAEKGSVATTLLIRSAGSPVTKGALGLGFGEAYTDTPAVGGYITRDQNRHDFPAIDYTVGVCGVRKIHVAMDAASIRTLSRIWDENDGQLPSALKHHMTILFNDAGLTVDEFKKLHKDIRRSRRVTHILANKSYSTLRDYISKDLHINNASIATTVLDTGVASDPYILSTHDTNILPTDLTKTFFNFQHTIRPEILPEDRLGVIRCIDPRQLDFKDVFSGDERRCHAIVSDARIIGCAMPEDLLSKERRFDSEIAAIELLAYQGVRDIVFMPHGGVCGFAKNSNNPNPNLPEHLLKLLQAGSDLVKDDVDQTAWDLAERSRRIVVNILQRAHQELPDGLPVMPAVSLVWSPVGLNPSKPRPALTMPGTALTPAF